jgi:hypothetical protein
MNEKQYRNSSNPKEVVMSTLTRTVKVYKQGALVRITTTAREALRASMLPTAGMTHANRLALAEGATFTESQLASLRKKAERNAVTLGERELLEVIAMQDETQARLASERGDMFGTVERDYEGANLHE